MPVWVLFRPMMSDSQIGQERKTGGHDERSRERRTALKIQKLGCLWGTGCCVHYLHLNGGPVSRPVTLTRVPPIRMAVSGSRIGGAMPACISHSPFTVMVSPSMPVACAWVPALSVI